MELDKCATLNLIANNRWGRNDNMAQQIRSRKLDYWDLSESDTAVIL